MNETKTRRETILSTVDDLAGAFLYYDRKEDQRLPIGAIDAAVAADEITRDEIAQRFKDNLKFKVKL